MASSLLLSSNFAAISRPTHRRRDFCRNSTSNAFSVSCAAAGNGKDSPQFDRRDMLLGMGGLYGATSLAPATAAPIPPPKLDTCGVAMDGDQPVAFNCCPPAGPTPTPYVLPTVTTLKKRPAFQLAGDKYFAKFERAIQAMKDLSEKDPSDPRGFAQQARVHCAYCNSAYPQAPGSDLKLQVHFSWLFFPFHRWYLYFYERILGKLIGDPTFALPFWNWDNPPGMVMPDRVVVDSSPLYNPRRNPTHYPPATADLQFPVEPGSKTPEQIVQNNLSQMYNEMIRNSKLLVDFYGGKYVVGSSESQAIGHVEAGSHTAMHVWVGENTDRGFDMGNFSTAGRDVLFYAHHTNIDRLWTVWRDYRDKKGKKKDFSDKDWLDSQFTFYDENANPVTVRVGDCLDNKRMGFTWDPVPNPWMDYKPRAAVKKFNFAESEKVRRLPPPPSFPAKLDRVIQVVVERPAARRRSAREKEVEEELLEISGIDVAMDKFVRFEVFVNAEDREVEGLAASRAEYAGCYSQVPMSKTGRMKTKIRFGLTELVEELGLEDDTKILVTVVPKKGGKYVSIGGIKVILDS
ncbi:polyphenol oxidase I, chloroplastic-like [Andrographis paniculata]|uniref:polyphenol oxidase I, chloroplastic-like n=1 Tax=Andrographis paniculata TaxID=175694 RepID=UPI0021E9705C|nr:polyphenol oxidase I, chloroplastic-like [Andrographis paniculata]